MPRHPPQELFAILERQKIVARRYLTAAPSGD
jgi:hypothetical protein